MTGTNYERNLKIEKALERIHIYLTQARTLVSQADPNSIPARLTDKSSFLSTVMNNVSLDMKSKESEK
jgi:hypothetical protein